MTAAGPAGSPALAWLVAAPLLLAPGLAPGLVPGLGPGVLPDAPPAWSPAGGPASEAASSPGPAGSGGALDDLAYAHCPGAGPVAYGVVPAMVACTNGPVQAGQALAHGFGFPPPGFSGRITSRLVGGSGEVRTFTCHSAFAANLPVVGLVSPSITCGGSGAFPFGQRVTQVCTVEGVAPIGGGGQGAASAGAWTCYLGA